MKRSPPSSQVRLFWVALLIGMLALPLLKATVTPSGAAGPIAQAWELARQSGSYSFRTTVDQQTLPEASLLNAGRPARHDYLTLQGSIDQPNHHMDLSLWRSLGPDPATTLQLRMDGTQVQ